MQLLYYAVKYRGDYHRISKALITNEKWEKIIYDGKYITLMDEDYPDLLLSLKYKPWVLFYEGNLDLLKEKMIGVVGSREMSNYGCYCVDCLMSHLNQMYGIVSGMARGIDGYAHQKAINNKRATIGIIGCGLNIVYPKENASLYDNMKKHHLILSEYPNDTKPLAHHFPWRNRIIAALSESLIVVEAKAKSGTMISVNEALELSKPIYCFPHRFNDEIGIGCNILIEQGSGMINKIEDIEEI